MKIVILSGKGGVGKSLISSSLAILFKRESNLLPLALDCDVDTPNLAIWLNEIGKWEKDKKISVSEKPEIDNSKIKNPKVCAQKCKFNALKVKNGRLELNPFLCEGCGACEIFCPKGAIKMKPVKNGAIKVKKTKYGFNLIVGQLFPGETGSGKIVEVLKKEAEKYEHDVTIIDSAPGTGCPVIAALKDANLAVFVTEPTPSAFSDLKRVFKLIKYFHIDWKLIINKWDINPKKTKEIEKWGKGHILGKISYDKEIFKSVAQLKPIMETNLKAKEEIKKIFELLLTKI
jgi:MinD superfamily P-loop ATPase